MALAVSLDVKFATAYPSTSSAASAGSHSEEHPVKNTPSFVSSKTTSRALIKRVSAKAPSSSMLTVTMCLLFDEPLITDSTLRTMSYSVKVSAHVMTM